MNSRTQNILVDYGSLSNRIDFRVSMEVSNRFANWQIRHLREVDSPLNKWEFDFNIFGFNIFVIANENNIIINCSVCRSLRRAFSSWHFK